MGTRWLTYAGFRLCNLTINQGKAFVRRGYHGISYQPQSNDNLQSRLKWHLIRHFSIGNLRVTQSGFSLISYRLAIQTLLNKFCSSPAKPTNKNILRGISYTLERNKRVQRHLTQGEIISHVQRNSHCRVYLILYQHAYQHTFLMGIPLRDTNISICPTIIYILLQIHQGISILILTKWVVSWQSAVGIYQTIICMLLLSGRQIQMEMP